MTFTYSGIPGTSIVETVRFLVGDTVATEHFLEDEEIVYLETLWGNKGTPLYVAAAAADAIAARLTREIDINSDGQSLSLGQLRDRFKDLAVELRHQHEDALVGGSSLYAGGMDAHQSPDASVAPLSFGTGMHDNPEAGNQDYGDISALEYAQQRAQWGEEVP